MRVVVEQELWKDKGLWSERRMFSVNVMRRVQSMMVGVGS